jgi:predicted MPP superfamily phosphohydrolase
LYLYVYWRLRPCFNGIARLVFSSIYFISAAWFIYVPIAIGHFWMDAGARSSEIMFALSISEFVIVGMMAAAIVALDILKICFGLWDRFAGTRTEAIFTARRVGTFSSIAVSLCLIYGLYEAWNIRTVKFVIPTTKLPAGVDRLRVVHVTDVHIGGLFYTRHLARIMKIARDAEPDIFVVTGDLVDGNMEYRSRESELLAGHGARYGAFAVTGNHEYYYDIAEAVEFIGRSGLTLLDDEMAEAGGIAVVGLDDKTEEWPKELSVPSDRFVLLLKHHPQVPGDSLGRFDLQLAGHTHGGQIWVFNHSMHRLYEFNQGLSKYGKSDVYVSNGAGFWGPPLRILAPPEVTVFDLVRQ